MKRHGLPQGVLSRIVASLIITGSASACNLLSNASFEEPAFPTAGSNFPPSVLNWGLVASGSPCNNGHTIVRNGSIYPGGPNAAADGQQYYQICGTSGYIYQSFSTARPFAIRFGASFGRRDSVGGGQLVIYDATNTEPIAESPVVTIGSGESKETWKLSSANFASLPAGDYVLRVNLNGAASVDNVFVHTMAASGVIGGGSPASVTEAALKCALDVSGPVISFNGGANPITIPITSPITVARDVTIDGGGKITLDAQAARRIFSVGAGVTLTLQNIKLANGYNAGSGGTIANSGTLVLTNVDISNSRAISHGGAIQNSGTLTCTNCRFDRNQAGVNGGAIDNTGTLNFTSSIASSNVAGFRGGGVYNYLGSVTSSGSIYRWNRANAYGGGVGIDAGSLNSTNDVVRGNYTGGTGGGLSVNAAATIRNATVALNQAAGYGGGIDLAGPAVTVEDSRFLSNKGDRGGAAAIRNDQSNTFTRTIFGYNSNTGGGGNVSNGGGAIYVFDGHLNATSCRFVGNQTSYAGSAVMLYYSQTATLNQCVITQGSGSFGQLGATDGGHYIVDGSTVGPSGMIGIWLDGGSIMMERSTVRGNAGGFEGGGIVLRRGGEATIHNSTISGNTANNGGGMFLESGFDGSKATLKSVTLFGNGANSGGNIFLEPGNDVIFDIENTIIGGPTNGGNCAGKIVSSSRYSISSDNLCALSGPGDMNLVNPLLGPLQSNGGPTHTHLPLTGSPAIDGIVGLQSLPTDQRGANRPSGLGYDIGAVEVGASGGINYAQPPTTVYTGVDSVDEDGDGMSDQDELLAGTDPSLATSVFRLTQSPTNPREFSFPTRTGIYYRIYSSLDLQNWYATGDPTIVGDGSTKVFTVTPTPGYARWFYRVRFHDYNGYWP